MNVSLFLTIGLPGRGMHLGIDPLSALFLCILAPLVLAAAVAAEFKSPTFWIFVLSMALALLAADSFSLILGLELMSVASWLMMLRRDRRAALRYAGLALFSAACLVPAVFLPASGLAFTLLFLGAAAQAGLAPLHFSRPRVFPATSAAVSAAISGGMVSVALYLMIRYDLLIFGNAVAAWWGTALVAAGAGLTFIGALRSLLEVELERVLAFSTIRHVGLMAVGLGIALRARALDDPALASMALQAALLCAMAQALFQPLLSLGAGAVQQATGTSSLDWLGGLMRSMPKLGVLMLLGAAGMAALPLGPGFASAFLLLHAVIGAAASGGVMAVTGFAALLAMLGLNTGLGLAAALRIIGFGFLGRPRSLHAAAAEEAGQRNLVAMGILAFFCVPLALLPGLVLRAIGPVISQAVPGALPMPLAYAPLPLLAIMAALAVIAFFGVHRFGARGEREAPAWNGGLGKPPVWLPFGDPALQPIASGFSQPVQHLLEPFGLRLAGLNLALQAVRGPVRQLLLLLSRWHSRVTIRQRTSLVFAVLVMVLLAFGIGQDS